MTKPFSFTQHERLKSKKQIDTLFQTGKAYFYFPFIIKYSLESNAIEHGIRFGISVPKRHFKKATIRNKLKRQSREAFRLQKNSLKTTLIKQGMQLSLMFIYTHNQACSYLEISKAIENCLAKIENELNPNPKTNI
ncbi:MAG: ribonuclease P protein component [Chitinophagaceae bacterium]|nr:ribonuclease P protein component [Chitinophagaceae bacterium]HMN33247.1 ribonuclease P protein component [Chitinophagaceae bacterium]